jgi:hypothetical protein
MTRPIFSPKAITKTTSKPLTTTTTTPRSKNANDTKEEITPELPIDFITRGMISRLTLHTRNIIIRSSSQRITTVSCLICLLVQVIWNRIVRMFITKESMMTGCLKRNPSNDCLKMIYNFDIFKNHYKYNLIYKKD